MKRDEEDAEIKEHYLILIEALEVFRERGRLRGSLWKRAGIEDAAHQIKMKGMRSMAMLSSNVVNKPELHEEAVDEMLDIINYAVFYVRLLRMHGNRKAHDDQDSN